MTITLIRHTKLDIEPGLCYGQSDILPHASFRDEAGELKNKIQDIKFDKVYSSPLSRCTLLAHECGYKNPQIEKRMAELNFGDWELKPWKDIKGEYAEKWFNDYVNTPALNGESLKEMIERVDSFIEDVKLERSDNVLCFTHAGCIRIFNHLLNKIPADKMFDLDIAYTGIYTFSL